MMPLYPAINSAPSPQLPIATDTPLLSDLPKVKGVEGAKAFPTKPNSRDDVWDEDENYIYIRRTNAQGQIISLDRYSYDPAPIPKPEDVFATKDDFNSLKGELTDVKQSIQELLSAIKSAPAVAVNTSGTKFNANAEQSSNKPNNGSGKPDKRSQYAGATNQPQS